MSPGMQKILLWAAIVLVVSYAFNVNPVAVVGRVAHSVQQMHNQQAGNP